VPAIIGPRQITGRSGGSRKPIDITLIPWAVSGMILLFSP